MHSRYKILGVDPGTLALGYAVIEVDANKISLCCVGTIELKKFSDQQTKLKEIYLQLQEIIETYLPSQMAVEAPFYGKNAQSMLKLGRAQGVSIAAGITMGLNIVEYAPKKIKQSITGNGNASKEQVASMVQAMLNKDLSEISLDASDALAAAITHYHQSKFGVPSTNVKGGGSWKTFINNNPDRIASK